MLDALPMTDRLALAAIGVLLGLTMVCVLLSESDDSPT
jgi:hypothetical protein